MWSCWGPGKRPTFSWPPSPVCPRKIAINILQDHGVCVSAGSACAKGHRSHVLEGHGPSAGGGGWGLPNLLSRLPPKKSWRSWGLGCALWWSVCGVHKPSKNEAVSKRTLRQPRVCHSEGRISLSPGPAFPAWAGTGTRGRKRWRQAWTRSAGRPVKRRSDHGPGGIGLIHKDGGRVHDTAVQQERHRCPEHGQGQPPPGGQPLPV